MPLLKFGKGWQLVALALGWTAALCSIDYLKNPRPWREFYRGTRPIAAHAPRIATPHVSLWMNHLCCSGCLDDVRAALKTLDWAGAVTVGAEADLPQQEDAAERLRGAQSYAGRVDVAIKDVKTLDFVELDRTLRATGLTAERVELGGLMRYRLEASLRHICCQVCSKALDQGLVFKEGLRTAGSLRWLDGVQVIKARKSVVLSPRPDADVDIAELFTALDRLGFAPSSLRVSLAADDLAVHMVQETEPAQAQAKAAPAQAQAAPAQAQVAPVPAVPDLAPPAAGRTAPEPVEEAKEEPGAAPSHGHHAKHRHTRHGHEEQKDEN